MLDPNLLRHPLRANRYGAPPLLISTGIRACSGAVIITDLKAEKTLTYDRLPQTCTPLRVIPAQDYDGDETTNKITWAADESPTSKTIVINFTDDAIDEGDEIIIVTLSTISGGATIGSDNGGISDAIINE